MHGYMLLCYYEDRNDAMEMSKKGDGGFGHWFLGFRVRYATPYGVSEG